ncbi:MULTISPECIES: acyl carrier protein [unclassified Curtobacterium]|jgi:acyl carrier protein|uniref:acyl carrier protein n=1 Tax=unclassified Curtobacterium TaxID=257496 RepID=UPI000F4986C2|nr:MULTISPECIES: acyl carrier protein [unclassified Curtobacterium]NQW88920.1 acyl carrier protein [Curtobacterium sp. VKM Ac-2861]MBF4585989.1 acyl carrier protein [Curtobacterium sp. VKM Ac-2887]MBF4605557.1 acyl carrier protein [Curtobacterium sp. VKM Ac-2884]ROS46261.1 acyl carrier protein [Curtobacterium sp. PhB78]RPE82248.1 acyl carrier protein [Curtobacterium sp. PhB137]
MDQEPQLSSTTAPTATTTATLADPAIEQAVRRALADHGRLTVDAQDVASIADLYALGLSSHATVNVMLAVESELDVEFPDSVLNRSTFATVESIVAAAELAS